MSSITQQVDQKRFAVFMLIFVAGTALSLILPPPFSTLTLGLVVFGSPLIVVGADTYRGLLSRLTTPLPAIHLPPISARWIKIGEVLLVVACLYFLTANLRNPGRLNGREFSYLVNSGAVAASIFEKTGAIPLWNPLIGQGEPLVENPFSFVLNPLMTVPSLTLGVVDGTRVSALLHVMLLGLGGWCLGNILHLAAPGRLLLALLIGGSGSVAGQLSQGFYQMALSQAYVPWVLAGVVGTLNTRERWPVGVLVVASTLMIFAGTFWYVLPAAISAGVVVLFYIVRWEGRLRLDMAAIRRLALAGVFILALAAVRLLPQYIHRDTIWHPAERLTETRNILSLLRWFFFPISDYDDFALYYHFFIPPGFALLVVTVRLLYWRDPLRWRLVLPALLLIAFYTIWATNSTFTHWLYREFPLLYQWRFPVRMLAAVGPWIVLLVALWFDEALRFTLRRLNLLRLGLAAMLVIAATSTVFTVLANWDWIGVGPQRSLNREPLINLRQENPSAFLTVGTEGFFDYMPFYDTLVRASFGNPDYRPLGQPSTLITAELDLLPRYAIAYEDEDREPLIDAGYQPGPDRILWEHPTAPTYAFTTASDSLWNEDFSRADTTPIHSYSHHMDRIEIRLGSYRQGHVLVVQETSYPGWRVTVNGEDTPIESVDGVIGVLLPRDPNLRGPLHIVFSYRPIWLYAGGFITVLAAVVFSGYLLGADRVLLRRIQGRTLTLPALHIPTIPALIRTGLELGTIAAASLALTAHLHDFSPHQILDGLEFSYLIKSGAVAHEIFSRTGAIPLWNPFMGTGEPLVEGPFSYIFNPFMLLPVLAWGSVVGTKIVLFVHIALMGFGGWVLGHVLKLGAVARVFLALLLIANGSFVAAIATGFYQMGLSQAYIPWVLAGVIALVQTRSRWPVGLTAVTSTLLVSAGTVWYSLPTAIIAAVFALFHLFRTDRSIDWIIVRRLAWALLLTVLVAAVRVLPMLVHREYVLHPQVWFNTYVPLVTLFGRYISAPPMESFKDFGVIYHYLIPLWVIVPLIGLRFAFVRQAPRWRIIVPSLLLILVFTLWAQENTAIIRWIYNHVPILAEWRILGRMMAAATPLLALLAALWLDTILKAARSRRLALHLAVSAGIIIVAAAGLWDTMNGWRSLVKLDNTFNLAREPLHALRRDQPEAFLSVYTDNFFNYMPFYETLIRAPYGSPDYGAGSITPTIPTPAFNPLLPEYGVATYFDERPWFEANYDRAVNDTWADSVLFEQDVALDYAFTVAERYLRLNHDPPQLFVSFTTPVTTYTHDIDSITVQAHAPGEVLVIMETAYPGWQVEIDGERAALESVGGWLGVRLPDHPARITFAYRPVWLYIGGLLTLIGSLITGVYLLRVDRRIKR